MHLRHAVLRSLGLHHALVDDALVGLLGSREVHRLDAGCTDGVAPEPIATRTARTASRFAWLASLRHGLTGPAASQRVPARRPGPTPGPVAPRPWAMPWAGPTGASGLGTQHSVSQAPLPASGVPASPRQPRCATAALRGFAHRASRPGTRPTRPPSRARSSSRS